MEVRDIDETNPVHVDFPASIDRIIERIDGIDAGRYRSTRNYFDGAVNRLSPYISRGVISGKQVLERMPGDPYDNPDAQALLQQLAWREYFQRVWQHLGDRLFQDIRQPQEQVSGNGIPAALLYKSTGIVAIDDQLQLLESSGYIHNHARMYIASLACNIARMHWHKPAEWMYYHLLDGDLASNTCSWQWVAGTFSSKKYYFNQENLSKYSGILQRNTFIDVGYDVLPRLRIPAALAEVEPPTLETSLSRTSIPRINTGFPTLLYNSYNLDPAWRAGEHVNRVLLLEPSHFKKYPVSKKVIDFVLALADNIPGIQLYVGEVHELVKQYETQRSVSQFISKEHPAFQHYPGIKDSRDWIFPAVNDYYSSFSKFWKLCNNQQFMRHNRA